MKKIRWTLETRFGGNSKYSDVIEFEDCVTDEEIEKAVAEYAYDWLDLWWEEVDASAET